MADQNPQSWSEWLAINGRVIGKLGGKPKNKFQWRYVEIEDGKCSYFLPTKECGKGESRGEFSLESSRVKRVDLDNWPEQYKKLNSYKVEGDHPRRDVIITKCFIYVNTLAGKQVVFMVKSEDNVAAGWLLLFQLKPFQLSTKHEAESNQVVKKLALPETDKGLSHTDALFSPRSREEIGGLRGFDKLSDVGFALEEITIIRGNFYTTHPQFEKVSQEKKYLAEEKFIDSDMDLASENSSEEIQTKGKK